MYLCCVLRSKLTINGSVRISITNISSMKFNLVSQPRRYCICLKHCPTNLSWNRSTRIRRISYPRFRMKYDYSEFTLFIIEGMYDNDTSLCSKTSRSFWIRPSMKSLLWLSPWCLRMSVIFQKCHCECHCECLTAITTSTIFNQCHA